MTLLTFLTLLALSTTYCLPTITQASPTIAKVVIADLQLNLRTGNRSSDCTNVAELFANVPGLTYKNCNKYSPITDHVAVRFSITNDFALNCFGPEQGFFKASPPPPSPPSPPPPSPSPPPPPPPPPPPSHPSPPPPSPSPPSPSPPSPLPPTHPSPSPPSPLPPSPPPSPPNPGSLTILAQFAPGAPVATVSCPMIQVLLNHNLTRTISDTSVSSLTTFTCTTDQLGVLNLQATASTPILVDNVFISKLVQFTPALCRATLFVTDSSSTNGRAYTCNSLPALCC